MIIDHLKNILAEDAELAELLERSVVMAREKAEADLDPDVFEALDWPRDLDEYETYLKDFIRWIPCQSDNKAWTKQAPEERYAKEVSDRLAHFFWLVDQPVHDGGAVAEKSEPFGTWLTDFARQWGSFLDTPESFSEEILESFLANAPEYTIGESLIDGKPNQPSGWLTFNQFFARELNTGLRPVAEPRSNLVIASPADCSYRHTYDIDAGSNIPATTIKNSHKYGNIKQLLEGSEYAEAFAGGTFVHYMLPPSSYHRFHLPVSGLVKESYVLNGKVYMQVDLEDHHLQSKDSSRSGYEFFQTRGVVTIDTSESEDGDLGIVGVVPVGMSHVSSVMLTAVAGKSARKGDEFGFFQFGGSDIILLFQAGVELEIDQSDSFHLMGSSVARCRRAG